MSKIEITNTHPLLLSPHQFLRWYGKFSGKLKQFTSEEKKARVELFVATLLTVNWRKNGLSREYCVDREQTKTAQANYKGLEFWLCTTANTSPDVYVYAHADKEIRENGQESKVQAKVREMVEVTTFDGSLCDLKKSISKKLKKQYEQSTHIVAYTDKALPYDFLDEAIKTEMLEELRAKNSCVGYDLWVAYPHSPKLNVGGRVYVLWNIDNCKKEMITNKDIERCSKNRAEYFQAQGSLTRVRPGSSTLVSLAGRCTLLPPASLR